MGLAAAGAGMWIASLPPLPIDAAREVSTSVVDRNGRVLRAFALADGRWRLPVSSLAEVDPRYVELLLAYEDRRFRTHHGVDPGALARAAWQFVREGRIVSGGSTISMQVARLMEPRRERSMESKFRQMVRAVQLERRFSKNEILSLYLTLAPFGGNIEGVRAASMTYFGKEPKRLTLAEAALLVAIPQSPEVRRPDRQPQAAKAARDRVIERMAGVGTFFDEDGQHAMEASVSAIRLALPSLAPHATEQTRAENPKSAVIKTTPRRIFSEEA